MPCVPRFAKLSVLPMGLLMSETLLAQNFAVPHASVTEGSCEEKCRLILDHSIDSVILTGPNREVTYVSPAFMRLSGYTPEELIADPDLFDRLVHPEDQQLFRTHLAQFEAPAHENIDLRIIGKDGQQRWITHHCQPVVDATGKFLGRIINNRDISRRKATEQKLRKAIGQARRFREALDHVNAYIFILDRESRYVYANQVSLNFFRCTFEDLVGNTEQRFFPPDAHAQLQAMNPRALAGESVDEELLIRFPSGERQFYRVVKSPVYAESERRTIVGLIGVATDITAQKLLVEELGEAQQHLLQAEKLASIGQLAAGVAHEINNPIGFIGSNFGTLENYLNDLFVIADAYTEAEAAADPQCPQLEQVHALKREKDYEFLRTDCFQLLTESKDGLARVAKIVRDLKDFSRVGEAEWQVADLLPAIDSTLNLVWNELKYKCTVTKDYGTLPPVWCVPSQLNQVFMNLLLNAGQAIVEKGEITIRTGQQDDQVFVAISDTGCGIAPENLTRLFDPFFTTKSVGSGTGLGLSLAYGIVQKHLGRIEVQSEVGKGTTFTVWLPINPPDQASAVPPEPTFEKS